MISAMLDNTFNLLKKKIPHIKKGILLKDYTTFKIGGPAEYFLLANKKEDIITGIAVAKKLQLPIFVFGGGSNVLVSDKGVKGLVIKIANNHDITLKKNTITAGAGVVLGELVALSINHSLQGLEWAGGLPGTFGGAIRGNAGAFGSEIKNSISQVQALDKKLQLLKLNNTQCQFSYRSSIFKKKQWIILSAMVKLKRGEKKDLQQIANSRIRYRTEKHPLEYPNAGSMFKNVEFKKVPPKFQKLFLDKVKDDPFPIVPSAWFIIGAGLTGKRIGGAQVSKKHSNYIVNRGGATAKDILQLIHFIQKKVRQKYGVLLEMEVQFVT